MANVLAYYTDDSINPLTTAPIQLSWQFAAQAIDIANDDSTNQLFWGYNQGAKQGGLRPFEHFTVTNNSISTVFIWSSSNSGTKYRVFATPN